MTTERPIIYRTGTCRQQSLPCDVPCPVAFCLHMAGYMVEAFTHRPVWQLYTEDAAANDKRFTAEILAALLDGGLLIFDLGARTDLRRDGLRAFYHYSRSLTRGETADLVTYLVQYAKLLGLDKRQRRRHREMLVTEQEVWISSSVVTTTVRMRDARETLHRAQCHFICDTARETREATEHPARLDGQVVATPLQTYNRMVTLSDNF